MVGMGARNTLKVMREILKQLNLNYNSEFEYAAPLQPETVRKKKGLYYTPKEITTYICFQAILYCLMQNFPDIKTSKNFISELSSQNLRHLFDYLQTLKILDPACGAGVFLVQTAEILYRFGKILLERLGEPVDRYELRRRILFNNIFGADLFNNAVLKTKIRLINWLYATNSSMMNQLTPNALDSNIIVGNSLIGWLNEDLDQPLDQSLDQYPNQPNDLDITQINQKFLNFIFQRCHVKNRKLYLKEMEKQHPIHWMAKFKDIMASGGFDIVVGNPPYVYIRGGNFSPFEKQFYNERYLKKFESLAKGKAKQSRKLNLFSLFIIRGTALLKPGGYLGFIVPNTILRTTTNDFIRQFILEHSHIQEIVDLRESIFKGVTASTILLFLQKTSGNQDLPSLINYNVRDLCKYNFDSHSISQGRFYKNPVLAFNIHLSSELETVFELMKGNSVRLGDLCKEIIEGIVCRKKDNLFTEDPSHPLAKKLLRGKDIGRYQINWKKNQYIIYVTDTHFTKVKLHRPRPQWIHEAPEKLLIKRISGGIYPLQVAYDNSQYYTFASINNLILKNHRTSSNEQFSYKCLLGILNSKLINAYYLLNYSNKSNLTVNISKTFLEALPIKEIPHTLHELIHTLADYLLFLYQYPGETMELINFYDSYIIDSLIYEMYFQDTLKTNLWESLTNYISKIEFKASKDEILDHLSILKQSILNDPSVTQIIDRIRLNPIIKPIEVLFNTRVNLIKTK